MHTPQLADNLRRALLQAAIEGKLSERQADDGYAQDLLKQIQAEKAAQIQAGRLKKSKALPEISEDEKPFAIPENWVWVRIGEIFEITSARRVHQKDWKTSGIPFYRAREIAKLADYGEVNNELFISDDLYSELTNLSSPPTKGDFMVSGVGTLGKTYIVKEGDLFYYKDASVLHVRNHHEITPKFFKYYMESDALMNQVWANSSGTTVATLTIDRFNKYLIPLPPLAEQARIVAKLDALLAETDALKAQESALADAQKNFPKMLRASLLQAAIEGKLTERESGDGHAQELLAAIQAEKAAQIQAGRLKKSKALPEIGEDEKTFAIPENWAWVRLGDLCGYAQRGKSPKYSDIQEYPVISQKCVQWSGFDISPAKFIDPESISSYSDERILKDDDLLWNSTGTGTVGRVVKYRKDYNPYSLAVADSHVTILRIFSSVNADYVEAFIKSPTIQANIEDICTGSTKQKELSLGTIVNLPIPLPPLPEQARIVAKLDALLAQIESLENLS
ncbi:restriction modification system DNA specificity domain [Neisseria zoodegmatis]|uniref:Restriction modification system DNA specificity domain n=1 Tax=Neisseria zoodegmatis TaxID=326523 RepID=A0A378X6V4_9NEIS|nr:restriction endonuclease subunit S [Neisseria zoodegmatis]SUA48737.1 restriction modification system DNA specificity domain [Neisseria zoodegmatis]